MRKRRTLASITCITLAVLLPGCPLEGNSLEGAWRLTFDETCDSSVDRYGGLVLDSNGSAGLYFLGAEFTGVWDLELSTITITILSPSSYTFTGAVSVNGTAVTSGTYTGTQSGCWTADRIEY